MFSPSIVESDAFLDMSLSAQALYFHLGMYADDDGFVNHRRIMRMLGNPDDDLKVLVAKRFLLPFESGVVVIKHWKMNNLVRKDWYRPTQYQEEKKLLYVKENGAYTLDEQQGIPLVNGSLTTSLTEIRIGKDRDTSGYEIVKDEEKPRTVVKPKYEQIFKLFGKYPLNWKTNKTQIQAAENLLEEHGLVQVRKALEFHSEMKEEPYCPQILTPWDLDTKWKKLIAFKKKHGD